MGKITTWNDPKITKVNPGLKLPKTKITVVRRRLERASFIFTSYLSKFQEWKARSGRSVNWPVGIGGQRTRHCNNVIKSSAAWLHGIHLAEANLSCAAIENQNGKLITADVESFIASAANADWDNAPGFYMVLTDQPGDKSWPITGVTYILMREDADPALRQEMIKYFNWCFTTGATAAQKLNYVPMPQNVVDMITAQVFK